MLTLVTAQQDISKTAQMIFVPLAIINVKLVNPLPKIVSLANLLKKGK